MRYTPRLVAVLVLALATLAAAAPGVKDDAGFFSPDVAQQAGAKLAELKSKSNRTVNVETYPEAPVELRGKIDGNDASKQAAYHAYTRMRLNALASDVYVLILKSPGHVEVEARNEILPPAERSRLANEIGAGFKARQFDQTLTRVVDALPDRLATAGKSAGGSPAAVSTPGGAANTPAPRDAAGRVPTNERSSTGSGLFGKIGCFGLIIIAVVVMLVISLIRRMVGGNRNVPPGGYGGNVPPGYGQGNYGAGGYGQGGYPPQTGGGFGRGIAGGLLGGLFGSWLGGNVFGQGHSHSGDSGSGHDTGGSALGGGGDASYDPNASGSSGADFGDSSSSSDFSSGSDFGGGDSGGGDSGSSGSDF